MPEGEERTETTETELPAVLLELEGGLDSGLEDDFRGLPPIPPATVELGDLEGDEQLARTDLREQISRMEAELAGLFGEAFPRNGIEFTVGALGGGPRILQIEELERVRDSMAATLQDVRGELRDRTYVEEKKRQLIEEMIAHPERYRWVRVSNEDIGEPGCRHWHSRPRWGPLGMLMGWWRVKLSSGCPLARGRGPAASRTNEPTGSCSASRPRCRVATRT
jgi:hypothetical protein